MPRNQAAGRRAGEDLASQGPTTRKRTREADDQRSKGKEEKDIKPTPSKKQKSKTATGGADEQGNEVKEEKETQSAPSKKQKSKPATSEEDLIKRKIDTLLSKYGTLPLADLGLPDPSSPSSENVLALVYNAMLTSTRISHELAHKSVKCLIEAGYHDIETLRKSTWEERTEVLTKGGYTRYREKTATGLGELAEFVTEKYGKSNSAVSRASITRRLTSLQTMTSTTLSRPPILRRPRSAPSSKKSKGSATSGSTFSATPLNTSGPVSPPSSTRGA